MIKYPKINSIYKRYVSGDIIMGEYSKPEFEYLKNLEWAAWEKIDGTNIRIISMPDTKEIIIKGRTDKAEIPEPLLSKLNDLFSIEKFSRLFENKCVCLYGEGYGEGIQNGGKYTADGKGVDFILFDVMIDGVWLERKDVHDIADKLLIQSVPYVYSGRLDKIENMVRKGLMSKFGNFYAEGVVARPQVELSDRLGNRIICKIKHKDFFDFS